MLQNPPQVVFCTFQIIEIDVYVMICNHAREIHITVTDGIEEACESIHRALFRDMVAIQAMF